MFAASSLVDALAVFEDGVFGAVVELVGRDEVDAAVVVIGVVTGDEFRRAPPRACRIACAGSRVEALLGFKIHFTPRGLRRTFNDLARNAKVEAIITKSISGHQTDRMREHYSTVSAAEQRDSIGSLLGLLKHRAPPMTRRIVVLWVVLPGSQLVPPGRRQPAKIARLL